MSPADCFLRSTPFAFWAALPGAGLTGVLGPSDRLAGLPFLLAILDMPPCLLHQCATDGFSTYSFILCWLCRFYCSAPLRRPLGCNIMFCPLLQHDGPAHSSSCSWAERPGAVSAEVALDIAYAGRSCRQLNSYYCSLSTSHNIQMSRQSQRHGAPVFAYMVRLARMSALT